MKKIVLSIFGIFALAACGGDVYQEADKQFANNPQNSSGDSSGNTVFTFDPTLPGHSVPGVPASGVYESPHSVTGSSGIMYHLINNTPFDIEIIPHIGFFCYGSWVDPYWNGGLGQFTMPGLFTDNTTPPPHLPKQYGNTIAIDPVKLGPWSSVSHGPSTGRFPLNGAHAIGGSGFTDSTNTSGDIGAMQEIGKIYFIKYEVRTHEGNANGVLKQKVGNDNMNLSMVPGHWSQVVPMPSDLTFNSDLALIYQASEPGGGSGSMEICLVNYPGTTIVPSEVNIFGHTLSFVTDADDVYIIFQ